MPTSMRSSHPAKTEPAVRHDDAPTAATVIVLGVTALLVVGQLYATVPLLDDLASSYRIRTTTAAWASTGFGLAYAAAMLVAGPLSDLRGRRQVAVAGVLLTAITTLGVAVAPNLAMLLTARVLQGAGAALLAPTALAYLGERIAPRHRSAALTTVISAFLAAAVLAPLAAESLTSIAGWRTWFFVTPPLLLVLAAALARILRPEANDHTRTSVIAGLAALPALLRTPRLIALYATTVTVMWTYVGLVTVAEFDGPGTTADPNLMQVVRAWTLPACVLVPIASPLLARVRSRHRLLGALVLGAIAAAGTGLASSAAELAVGLGLATAAVAATSPALVESISAVTDESQRGAAAAGYGFCLFAGASLGPLTATALHGIGFAETSLCLASITAAGAVTAALVVGRHG